MTARLSGQVNLIKFLFANKIAVITHTHKKKPVRLLLMEPEHTFGEFLGKLR